MYAKVTDVTTATDFISPPGMTLTVAMLASMPTVTYLNNGQCTSGSGFGFTPSNSGHFPGQDQAQGCGPGLDTKVAIQVQRQSTTTDVISFSIREMPMPGPAGSEYAQPYKVFVLQRTCALSSKDPESCYFDSRNTGLLSGSPFNHIDSDTSDGKYPLLRAAGLMTGSTQYKPAGLACGNSGDNPSHVHAGGWWGAANPAQYDQADILDQLPLEQLRSWLPPRGWRTDGNRSWDRPPLHIRL